MPAFEMTSRMVVRCVLAGVTLAALPTLTQAQEDPVVACGAALLKLEADFAQGALGLAPVLCKNPQRFDGRAARLVTTINADISRFNTTYSGQGCDPDVPLPLPAKSTDDVRLALEKAFGPLPLDRVCNSLDDPDTACGNDQEDAGEVCDGADLAGQTCATLGNGTGTLRCASGCQDFDLSDCSGPAYCGNGKVELGEACDGGGQTAACNGNCTPSACGDGVVNSSAGEQCDAGGETATCGGDCKVAYCGDGRINIARGEQCDDLGPSARCNYDCTVSFCGDGKTNLLAGEKCDDANLINGDGCSNVCLFETC